MPSGGPPPLPPGSGPSGPQAARRRLPVSTPLLVGMVAGVAAVTGIVAMIRCRSGWNTWLELGVGFACVVTCVVGIATRLHTGGSC